MQDRIKRAVNGDASAMKEIFEANWRDAAALCRVSLRNEEEESRVLERACGDACVSLLGGSFETEDAFRRSLTKHTAMLCRRSFQRNGAKSLPIPMNKQFLISGKITVPYENASVTDILAASMPEIQRFLFAMHRVAGMDEKEISAVTGYKDRVLESAMLAEEKNLRRFQAEIEGMTGLDTDPEAENRRYKDTLYLPQACRDRLLERIEQATEPIRRQKQRKKALAIGGIAAILVIIAVCCAIFLG